jgi:hypothetical protein
MTSLRSHNRALPWRHNDGTSVGRRNPTVAALRAFQPSGRTQRGGQHPYPPKGSSRLLRKHGVIHDETKWSEQ